jgi:hypothetical protein
VAIISSNSNTILFGCKSTRQLQRQSILMQLNVIMAILLTDSNTFQKMVAIGLTSCNAEHKNYNTLFLWQHSPPYCHVFGQMLQNTSLLQHNLWWCKWRQVAIGSKSCSFVGAAWTVDRWRRSSRAARPARVAHSHGTLWWGPSRVCGVSSLKRPRQRVLRIALIARGTRFGCGHLLGAGQPKRRLGPTSSDPNLSFLCSHYRCI